MSKRIKICQHCNKQYANSNCLKDCCYSCYHLMTEYGTINPSHWNKKCEFCGNDYISKLGRQIFCSQKCYQKQHTINTRTQYRIDNGIDLNLPVKDKKPNGSGHKDPHGYTFITKMRHPNAQKNGRIYEHTLVMSEFLGRPLMKGENVHHKNGIKDDNRIENLELWSTNQPAGQRVEDKIKWCKEFLEKYKDFKI
jgi:hypothetical protein